MRHTHQPLSHLFGLVLIAVLLGACSTRQPTIQGVRDLEILPQNLTAYLDQRTARSPLLDRASQQDLADAFLERHFKPWNRTSPAHDADVFQSITNSYLKKKVYGENLQLRPPQWAQGLAKNARLDAYPNINRLAVAIANTSLRLLPTADPGFSNPMGNGEGYPFDYLQNSAVWAGTPLFAAHLSADHAWVLVESRFAAGWVPVRDIGFVDDVFIRRFQLKPLLTFTTDNVPLLDGKGGHLLTARIGALLPFTLDPQIGQGVLAPVRMPDGTARLVPASLPEPGPRGGAVQFPLVMTPWNIAAVGNQMIGQPYGWGGMHGKRDCSATLMDLFTPFGIYLPRNSKAQAQSGTFVDLTGLSDQNKERTLLNEAQPFTTLVRKPGHIMLYVGRSGGRAIVYHSVWGLASSSKAHPTPGRIVIGRTAITTLTPASERHDLVKPGGLLLHKTSGMTYLLPQ